MQTMATRERKKCHRIRNIIRTICNELMLSTYRGRIDASNEEVTIQSFHISHSAFFWHYIFIRMQLNCGLWPSPSSSPSSSSLLPHPNAHLVDLCVAQSMCSRILYNVHCWDNIYSMTANAHVAHVQLFMRRGN